MKNIAKKLLLLMLIFSATVFAAQSENFRVRQYVFDSAGSTQSAVSSSLPGITVYNRSSIGETLSSQSWGESSSAQAGYFNEYFMAKPTATVTPTVTVTATPRVDPEGFDGKIISKKTCYAYPNPSRGHVTKFRVYTKESARVEFKIFTLQSKFVWSTTIEYSQIGYNELRWNNADMANGGYFMLVKARGHETGREERVVKPFAIIK